MAYQTSMTDSRVESDESEDLGFSTRQVGQSPHYVSMRAAALLACLAAIFSACITTVVHWAAPSGSWSWNHKPSHQETEHISDILQFSSVPASALPGEELFSELSPAEIHDVADFVAKQLGCTTTYVNLTTCFLTGAEAVSLKRSTKSSVLAYLDSGETAPLRMARVVVAHGEKPLSEGVGLYDVGPLDGAGGLAKNATLTLVKSLHWNYRPLQMDETSTDLAVSKVLKSVSHLLTSTFGPVFPFLEDYDPAVGTAVYWTGANVFSTLQRRSSRFWFNWFKDPQEFQVSWLHTLPFNFDMAHEGPPEEWKAVNISICGQFYQTVDDLVTAYSKGKVWQCNGKQHTRYSWDVPGPFPAPGKFADPSTSTDSKVRQSWNISPKGSIKWRDWELIATVRPASGLALYDLRFRGERILYELSLSDCHAYYAGPAPGKQYHFSDKAYSLSQISGDMVAGLDCPADASFIQGSIWIPFFSSGGARADPKAAKAAKLACVFESDGFQGSSWRHTQLINRKVSGRPKKVLVIRAIGTVGNYDYISEVHLGEDGSVKVRESFAGYPEVDWTYGARSPKWGSVVRTHNKSQGDLVQNLHGHFCVWKVDLDVLGLENEFHSTKIMHSRDGKDVPEQKIQVSTRIESEDPDMELVANPKASGVWRIVNPKAHNPTSGSPRGYAVVIGSAPSVHTYEKNHPFALSASFARRHLAVTQRKEEEPEATSVFDFYPVTDPLYSVDNFLADRESLVAKDLVCWVSLGKEHAARTEDQPLVTNFMVEFSLLPWDYHDQNPEMILAMKGDGPEDLLSKYIDKDRAEVHP